MRSVVEKSTGDAELRRKSCTTFLNCLMTLLPVDCRML